MKPNPRKFENKKLSESLKHANDGLFHAIRTQKNVRIQIWITIIVLTAAIFFQLTKIEWLFLIISIFFSTSLQRRLILQLKKQ